MGWSYDEWPEVTSSPDWGQRVVKALRRYFAQDKWLLEPAWLEDASLDVDPDGMPVLLAHHRHSLSTKRLGLRHRLDRPPLTGGRPGGLAEEAVAADIALFDISEPLGRMYDLLVEDGNGVWWWGDGYPGLMEHPDFKR